jgi:exodeoxyribonuclease V beta subunit
VTAAPETAARVTTAATPFDLLGALPQGTTVLEASAGTGKTFTIAALVARYVAEGVATMDELLVVSFSRESTRELRERVRERLVSARDGLEHPGREPAHDQLLAHLAGAAPSEVTARRRRLDDALAAFDAATVTTTHGFCQQVLMALGTAGDHDPGAVLMESTTDLISEVADDLYLRKWGHAGAEPAKMTRNDFGDLAQAAAGDPATHLVPDDPATGELPGLRARIAAAVRTEVDRRKRRQHLIDYDDMLVRLARTLTDPDSGPPARARLRSRYRVVLVDEFQDTDPVQWTILREAFHGHRTLVLIGDPKQAIYGFRGADVHAYLEAAGSAGSTSTLPTNWRSDPALLDGLAAIFHGAALGDRRIRVVPVVAAHTGRMVADADADAAVQLRVLRRDGLKLVVNGTISVSDARDAIAADLAIETVALLDGARTIRPRDGSGARALRPGDVAVLVRTNKHARQIQDHLRATGVPVVLTGRTSVFSTPAADEWQLLLEALEQPHRVTRVRRLALGAFVGLDATDLDSTELDAAAQARIETLALNLRSWGRVLEERGMGALFEAVSRQQALQQRLLGRQGGERLIADLRHIAQALHEAALEGQLGITALLGWLLRRRAEAARDGGLERSRRLESDADAVQVITVHASKGLEFPVVMVPYGWDCFGGREPSTAVFHDQAGRRVRDVGGRGSPDWAAHVSQHKQDETDDELRLTYVALTRAQSRIVVWWAPTSNTPQSPLQRLLLHDDPSVVAPPSIPVPTDAAALVAFRHRAATSSGGLAVALIAARPPAVWVPPAQVPAVLAVASFTRSLDAAWRRTSYSALTASAHDLPGRLSSEPEVAEQDDESDVEALRADSTEADQSLLSVPSGWDGLAAGTSFGTLTHAVLEHLDDPADAGAVRAVVATQAAYGPGVDVDTLTTGLLWALATPLGAHAGDLALRDVRRADRLPELDFELPLAGGDRPDGARVLLADLVPLWRAHCPTGPLASYADVLAGLPTTPLRGYLTGSIDAVVRIGAEPDRRYLVVDYKTNRLGGRDEPLTAWHYRPQALERAMIDAHYPLQALLYSVALHRYLRWRQPGYDPQTHLGGVLYLFLRGMSGPAVTCADGSRPGVFSWRPPADLVTALSDLLAGRR